MFTGWENVLSLVKTHYTRNRVYRFVRRFSLGTFDDGNNDNRAIFSCNTSKVGHAVDITDSIVSAWQIKQCADRTVRRCLDASPLSILLSFDRGTAGCYPFFCCRLKSRCKFGLLSSGGAPVRCGHENRIMYRCLLQRPFRRLGSTSLMTRP